MENDKKVIIEWLEERLRWYTYEVSEEEFDEEEVYIISKLLQKLYGEEDKYFNSGASIKRFQERYGVRFKTPRRTKTQKQSIPFYRRGSIIKAAVIASICAVCIFGMSGTVQAVKGDGLKFFQILSEDAMGRKVVVNGAAVDVSQENVPGVENFELEIEEGKEYTSWEEVPGLLGEYVCVPIRNDITVKTIAATDWSDELGQLINICYLVGDLELWCSINRYPNVQYTVSERYQFPLTLKETIETEAGLSISIRQAPCEDMFGAFFAGRGSYLFSGEFTREEFTEIMGCVERVQF